MFWNRKRDVIDGVNDRIGQGAVILASKGFRGIWLMQRENKSQNYTTDWDDEMYFSD